MQNLPVHFQEKKNHRRVKSLIHSKNEAMAGKRSGYLACRRTSFSVVRNLFQREISAMPLQRTQNPFGKTVPDRLNMPMESILPTTALRSGHIFLGFTDCGRFLLSYTIREEFENAYNRNEMAFFYKLHIWLFKPYQQAKRVASVVLFSNTGIADNNLLIDTSQWKNDDSRIVILGRNYSPEIGGVRSLFYVTMTTLPSTSGCKDCNLQDMLIDFDETIDIHAECGLEKGKCLRHCITTHLVYERVPPFPNFDFDIQLNLKNSIVLNTGNALHVFSYNICGVNTESAYISELLKPPKHHEPKKSKKRLLRCDFWLKLQFTNCLQNIFSNCSSREPSRITTAQGSDSTAKTDDAGKRFCDWDQQENCIREQEAFLSCIPLSMTFDDISKSTGNRTHSRRLSQSSVDSDLSAFSTLSRTTSLSQPSTEISEVQVETRPISPPKRFLMGIAPNETVRKVKLAMPPPRRKFFKTGQNTTIKKSFDRISTRASPSTSTAPKPVEKTYDIFDVSVEEVLLERSLSSYRKRRNADKQYEFSDPDVFSENFVPLKLTRNRGRKRLSNSVLLGNGGGGKSPRSAENSSPTDSMGYEGLTSGAGVCSYPRSPRSLTVQSPAMSPNCSELGDILRPLTNYTNLSKMSPTHPLFSPPLTREFCEGAFDSSKLWCRSFPETVSVEDSCDSKTSATGNEIRKEAKPTLTTNVNCIAKILRCYVDKDDDTASVKTDTDDEYNQTAPFPVALNLDVHGTGYRSLQLINNSKVNGSSNPVVEVLQRTLEFEILCNEVASIICLSADKTFISCFDYDVAVLDVCPDRGNITAVAVVLIYASDFRKDSQHSNALEQLTSSWNTSIHASAATRQKYEAIFSFQWMPVEESCQILHIGHMRQIDSTPEIWNPTKDIFESLKQYGFADTLGSKQRVLTNELAVFEWQSLDELVDSTGLIRLRSDGGIINSTSNSRSNSLTALTSLGSLPLDITADEDEYLSDYY